MRILMVLLVLMSPVGKSHARTVIRAGQKPPASLLARRGVLVIGSSSPKAPFCEARVALRLGRAIARRAGVVVTGGGAGLPYAAARGAHRAGGKTISVAPWSTTRALRKSGDPLRGFTHVWLTKVPKDLQQLGISEGNFNHWMHRQTHDVAIAGAVVVTPGHGGTLGELGNAMVLGKPVAVLELPGKDNMRFNRMARALAKFNQETKGKPQIRFFSNPERAAAWAVEQAQGGK